MKRLTLFAFLIVAGTVSAFAQNNTIIGKWKLSSYSGEGMNFNLDNPVETKKAFAEQLKKETGTVPDSAQVEVIYNMMMPMFTSMSIEFTNKGNAYLTAPNGMGVTVADTASYVVDYSKGTFTVTSKTEGGEERKDTSKFKFEGALLVVENTEKSEITKFKRAN